MNGIEFEKEVYKPMVSMVKREQKSLIMSTVFKLSGGRIQTETQASKVLLIVTCLLIIFTVYNIASMGNKVKVSETVIQNQKRAMNQTMNNAKNY